MKHLLKGFKKINSDDKSTTFQHPNGHTIKIAHKALNKKMRSELEDLPHMYEGGKVNPLHKDYSIKRSEAQESFTGKKMDIHRETDSEYRQRRKDFGPSTPRLDLPAGMANGGEAGLDAQPNTIMDLFNLNQGPSSEIPPMSQMSPEQANSEQPIISVPPSNIEIPQAPTQAPIPSKGSIIQPNMQGLMGQVESGMKQEANAIGEASKQAAQAATTHQNELKLIDDSYKQRRSELDKERISALNDYRSGHIDPEHYLHSKSGFGQAMTALGMILGGIGSGLTGGPNQALDFINKQIDRDIEGQKAELGKKQNLLSHLNEEYGNLKDSSIMAKAMQADMYAAKLTQIAEASKDPQAKARAMQAAAQLHMQYEPQLQEMAIKQGILGAMNNGQISASKAIPWMVPREHQTKALEEVKDAEVMNNGLRVVSDAMHDVEKLQSVGNRMMSPIQSKSQINAINLKISSLAKELFGKVSDQEIGMLEDAHIGFTDDAKTAATKLKTIQDVLQKHASTPTLDAFGIKVPRYNTNVRTNSNAR